MRWWIVLCTFLSLSTAGSGSPPSDMVQFWRESPITMAFMRDHISNVKCHASPEYLASCRAAVVEAKKLMTGATLNASDDFDAVLAKVDASHDVKMPKQFIFGRMLNAHLKAFDAHAFILPVPAVEAMLGAESRSRFGIGVHFLPTVNAGLLVGSVTANSPASVAGLRVGDRLLSISGKPVGEGLQALDSLSQLTSHPGDTLALEIEHQGQRQKLNVPVGVIEEENVTGELLSDGAAKYAYVKVRQFRDSTCSALKNKIAEFSAQARGLILDLRDNMGGRLDEGICVSDLFVGQQKIVGEKLVEIKIPLYVGAMGVDGSTINWQSGALPAAFPDLALVVLVNPVSASASEIVAAAVQDTNRAWIVGEPTYGKGTIQAVRPLNSDARFSVGFTVALFYRPNGNTNQLVGVEPNFTVPYRPGAAVGELAVLREIDINPNALRPTDTVTAWKESRPQLTTQIGGCISSSGRDTEIYKGLKATDGDDDYQKAYGVAVLACSLQHNTLAKQE